MPTHDETDSFRRDFARLNSTDKQRFLSVLEVFIADLSAIETGTRKNIRSGLRAKGVQGTRGVFEMTWAPDGRATFSYGDPVQEGARHVEWRRCGTHSIFRNP